ncbi:MAG: TonB-dependent receptor [Rhodocyclaceae bacterium]|jgi:outer membrane receptor for ferrienterochelin and colicins|nr:TonB-dependent receptor [Rhodocyclaceae bacterium]
MVHCLSVPFRSFRPCAVPAGKPARAPLARALSLALLAGTLPTAVFAQDTSTQLREVVVSASGFEQELRHAPASISVVTREQLESKQFRDLAEALKDVEGVDVRGATGKTGGLNISIRGMPSDYTLILIDGRRQNVAGDVTPNGFDDALTSFIPPISAIERIEVIRGPMSTLYGSDAMGGVVNIITRKVASAWTGSLGLEAGLPEDGDEGKSGKFNFYATGPIVKDTLGLAVRGNLFRRGESDILPSSGEGTISRRGPSPVETRQHTLGAKLTLTPSRDHDIWLDLEQGRTWYNNDECQLGTRDYINCNTGAATSTASGYEDAMRFNRDQLAIGHSSRLGEGMLESSLMRTATETTGRTIPSASRPSGSPDIGSRRTLETTNTVLDSKYIAPLGDAHIMTLGGQWWDAKLEDSLLPESHSQTMWSLFAEDEWRFTDSLAATLGLRYDRHDAFGGELSPRAYLVWDASENWTVKGGVSQGFKAPRLNQLIDGVAGIGGQGTVISIGNPDLRPETSTSTELGMLYDSLQGMSASATLFHNRIKDKIGSGGDCAVDFISSCAANPTATYSINNDEGKTWGVELSSRIALAERWSLNLNYTYTDSELVQAGSKSGKLSDTARHVANAQLRWDPSARYSLWLRGEYRGDSRRFDGDPASLTGNDQLEYQALGDLRGYTLFHLGGAYRMNKDITFNANIFNLFDKDFRKFSAWTNNAGETVWGSPYLKSTRSTKGTLPSGRTFWVSANIHF